MLKKMVFYTKEKGPGSFSFGKKHIERFKLISPETEFVFVGWDDEKLLKEAEGCTAAVAQNNHPLPTEFYEKAKELKWVGTILTNCGVGTYAVGSMFSWAANTPVLLFMIIVALIYTFFNTIFPNAASGLIVAYVSLLAPMVMGLGLNPALVLAPVCFLSSNHHAMGMNVSCIITYDYGYWKMKDCVWPGIVTEIIITVVYAVLCYLLFPLIGMPVTI